MKKSKKSSKRFVGIKKSITFATRFAIRTEPLREWRGRREGNDERNFIRDDTFIEAEKERSLKKLEQQKCSIRKGKKHTVQFR